ncbi:MAG: phospho-sugar mutase [Pirellulales bacterium]
MDHDALLAEVTRATGENKISDSAARHVRIWLEEPRYAQYAPQVAEHIEQGKWKELDDAFWTIIPFGTGGRRGTMYPIGTNAVNDRTIGESAQGLAEYVQEVHGGSAKLSCAIAYDTRHRSRHFAQLCAEIMTAAGFTVYFLDGHRSTPELSFAVRMKSCSCGIMVTASHNPPSDNAVKVYWSTGGQLLPPHDKAVIDKVMNVQDVRRKPFDEALAEGQIVMCQDEVDRAFVAAVVEQAFEGPRDLKILYSPLHGVGATAVYPVLKAAGFNDVEIFGPHAEPDGDFPNVPEHVSNPENPAVFDSIIEHARTSGAEIVMASDPDCDRIGCAAPLTLSRDSEWRTFTGNQIGALLTEYVLDTRRRAGTLSADHYLVKTLVTTDMVRRIGDAYGVRTYGDLLVGFKWIGGVMDEKGPERFVLGVEESHGYLVGQYARDKDASVAAMYLAELAAQLKTQGETLHTKLDSLFWQYGAHAERTVSTTMPGAEGMVRIKSLMSRVREIPPRELAGIPVRYVRDYGSGRRLEVGGPAQPLAGPKGDLVMLDLESEGTYVAVRPSGTEPKVKFYLFAYQPPEALANLEDAKAELRQRLSGMERDLTAYAEA